MMRTINMDVVVNVNERFVDSPNMLVVTILVDDQFTRDRCNGCGWAAWRDDYSIVQRNGPMTTLPPYLDFQKPEVQKRIVEDVMSFLSRNGFDYADRDDYDSDDEWRDSYEYDGYYIEAIDELTKALERRPSDEFMIWDPYGPSANRAPRFCINVALVRIGGW